MKSILTFILATFLLFPLQAQEKVYTVDNLPKVHLQNKMQYVCNPAGILSQAACDSIDSMLYALEQQTGIETVVAVVPSIGEEDCFDFCHQLLNKWGVGKKGKNNGNHTIFRHANFIGCLSADKIKMPVRKYFCFNIPVYRNMAEEPSCRSPYHEEYIQTSVSGNSEGLCRSTYSFLSERR